MFIFSLNWLKKIPKRFYQKYVISFLECDFIKLHILLEKQTS